MRTNFRQASLLVSTLTLSLLLTACSIPTLSPSDSQGENSADSSSPTPTYDSSDGRYVTPETNPDAEYDVLNPIRTGFKETVFETRTDVHGTYAVTKIDYPSIDSVSNKGVSKSQLDSALKFYTDFVALEVMDSIAFDDNSRYDEWVKNVAPKYIAAENFDEIVNAQKNGTSPAAIIFNNLNPDDQYVESRAYSLPVLLRDGGPRVINKKLWSLQAEPIAGGIYLSGSANVFITTDDSKHTAWDIIQAGEGRQSFEIFNDGKPSAAQFNAYVGLTLIPDGDSWKITGFSNSFMANPSYLLELPPEEIFDWRREVLG